MRKAGIESRPFFYFTAIHRNTLKLTDLGGALVFSHPRASGPTDSLGENPCTTRTGMLLPPILPD